MNENFFTTHKRTIGIFIFFVLLISIPLIIVALSNRTDLRQRASEETTPPADTVASVDGEFITNAEYKEALGLHSYILRKEVTDPDVRQDALDFVINKRLLQKEAQNRDILQEALDLAESRFQSAQRIGEVPEETQKSYYLYRTILQKLEPLATKWRMVDYLSIRYRWTENPEREEIAFKQIAEKKINEYYNKILSGLDIKEAIRQRCTDPEIDYLPFGEHQKVFQESLENGICRDQQIGRKVSKDTNPEWGDKWLSEVFKLQKGQLSPIIVYEEPSLGMYFIVKVVEDGGGDYFSMEDLLNKLRVENNVFTFVQ